MVRVTLMGEAVTRGDLLVKVTLVEDEGPQPPPASDRGQPNLAPRKEQQGEQQGEKRAAPPSTFALPCCRMCLATRQRGSITV